MTDPSRCPTCDAPLEATAVSYLENVTLSPDGHIAGFDVASSLNDRDGYVWDHPTTRVYCANDHEHRTWEPPATLR